MYSIAPFVLLVITMNASFWCVLVFHDYGFIECLVDHASDLVSQSSKYNLLNTNSKWIG
jgi:hypothetical protein